MKRMQALQGTRIFKDMLGGAVAVNVEATSKEDLDMKDIAVKSADCGGAHKPSHYDFSSMKLSLEDIGKVFLATNIKRVPGIIVILPRILSV